MPEKVWSVRKTGLTGCVVIDNLNDQNDSPAGIMKSLLFSGN